MSFFTKFWQRLESVFFILFSELEPTEKSKLKIYKCKSFYENVGHYIII